MRLRILGLALGLVSSSAITQIAFAQTSTPAPAAASAAPAVAIDPRLTAAWDRYYATLAELRRTIEASPQFRDVPAQRAKAYHVLMEIQAMAYNFAVGPRMEHPRIFRNTGWQTDMYTMGGNGPDFDYRLLYLDGKRTYKLTGNMRDSRLVLAQLSGSLPGTGGSTAARNYDFQDFQIRPDGSFEVMISATRQPGNWIQLDPDGDYQMVHLRPTVDNWDSAPAEFQIEEVGPVDQARYIADEFDPGAMAHRIDLATGYARYMMDEWAIAFYPRAIRENGGTNRMKRGGSAVTGSVGSPTAEYVMGTYDLKDDEALLIELGEEPQGIYWSFQTFDVWLRSIDFRNRQTTLNEQHIVKDADGKIHIVLSKQDPGIANWLDTAGIAQGQILLRNYRTPRPAVLSTRVVKVADLGRLLPAGTRRVTPQQRAEALEQRRQGYLRRHGE